MKSEAHSVDILAIETSCDETAAAVVRDGRVILASVVASQAELHRQYGGIYPEFASRQHILSIIPVIERTLATSGINHRDLEAVAVVSGPGLAGSLLVGVNTAKSLSLGWGLPLIGINHLEAHMYANWLVVPGEQPLPSTPEFPLLCLIVSGGHTDLVLMSDHGTYEVLGRTMDDAAGEAFDKVGRLLGLGFPGGPAIQAAAKKGNPTAFEFPRAWLEGRWDFSFSGVKTAVLREVQRREGKPVARGGPRRKLAIPLSANTMAQLPVADLAASFQAAVVDVLVEKTRRAAAKYAVTEVLLAGGVAANVLLRERISEAISCPVRCPPIALCTDNAAMVGSVAYFRLQSGARSGWDLDVDPGLALV